jgi:hypothetical protein
MARVQLRRKARIKEMMRGSISSAKSKTLRKLKRRVTSLSVTATDIAPDTSNAQLAVHGAGGEPSNVPGAKQLRALADEEMDLQRKLDSGELSPTEQTAARSRQLAIAESRGALAARAQLRKPLRDQYINGTIGSAVGEQRRAQPQNGQIPSASFGRQRQLTAAKCNTNNQSTTHVHQQRGQLSAEYSSEARMAEMHRFGGKLGATPRSRSGTLRAGGYSYGDTQDSAGQGEHQRSGSTTGPYNDRHDAVDNDFAEFLNSSDDEPKLTMTRTVFKADTLAGPSILVKTWGELSATEGVAASMLGFTESSWPSLPNGMPHLVTWDRMAKAERASASTLGFTESSWPPVLHSK